MLCPLFIRNNKLSGSSIIDGAEIITADAKGFYAGFKYGWSKGKNIFGKISMATACATVMSIACSAVAAIVELGFEYLGDLVSYHKGMPKILIALDNSYNLSKIQTYRNQITNMIPNLVQDNTSNKFNTSILHNLMLRDIEEVSNNTLSSSYYTYSSNELSTGTLTPTQLQFLSTPEFIQYYNSLKNIYLGNDTFENHFTSPNFSTTDIVINKYIEGISKYNFSNSKEIHFTTQTLCKEYINVVQNLTLDSEIKSNIISTLYVVPLSALYWYSE